MMFLGRETYQPVEVLFGEPYLGYAQDVKGEVCDLENKGIVFSSRRVSIE